MAGQIDLASIIGQAAQTNANQTGYAQAESGQYQKAAGQQGVVADNIERAGDLESQAKLTELTGELNTQQARVKAANALGTNINDVSNIITDLGAQYRQDAMGLIDAQNKVSDLEANNDLLTNPLGWFKDLLIGGNARAQRDALAQKVDTEAKTIQNLNSLTQTTVQTQNAITETLSATSIAQTSEAIRAKAAAQAADARTNAAKYGAASIEALAQTDAQNFNRNLQAYNLVQENERLNLARQEHSQRMKALNDADAEIQDTLDNINAYEKQFGRPLTTKMMLKKYYGSQGELGNYMRDADLGGFKLRQSGGIVGVLGTTPADAFATAKGYNLNLPDSFKPSQTILNATYSRMNELKAQVNDPANPMGVTIKDASGKPVVLNKESFKSPEAMKATFNTVAASTAAGFQSRVVPGTENPYGLLPISSVLQSPNKTSMELARSKFGQTVLANLQTADQQTPTPELLMQTSLASVNKGEITFNEAAEGIQKFYASSVALNNATGGFQAFNLPTAVSYNVLARDITGTDVAKIETGAISGAAQTVKAFINPFAAGGPLSSTKLVPQLQFDLTKQTDVTTALTMMQSSKMRAGILNAFGETNQ